MTGFLDRSATSTARGLEETVRAMADRLSHRGPDDAGTWVDEAAGIALGHRRLSVIDLTPAGHQPMTSASGRYVIAFNGEIYNFRDLRRDLTAKGHQFHGHSDTEVMLAAFDAWGVPASLKRFVGMFAFAVWDRQQRVLMLARDHLGIKPLYYATGDGMFLFGSELKALRAHTRWQPTLDRDAVAAYMRFGYVPAPLSIWRDARKLPPGTLLTVAPDGDPEISAFWRMIDLDATPLEMSDAEATDALDELLHQAVGQQMIADVPLGAFLSGGIDSSTVVALMQVQSGRPVKTFSIGFNEPAYNEAPQAKAVADHLGTDHTELYVTADQALDIVPHLGEWYDEPFADSSQIPTCLVSRLARRHVTVALSGDGGDESFGGYNRYFHGTGLWTKTRRIPLGLRRTVAQAIETIPAPYWDGAARFLLGRRSPPQLGAKLHKAAAVLALDSPEAVYLRLVSQWQSTDGLVIGGREPDGLWCDPALRALVPDFFSRMQVLDTLTYLPDDILTKVDRASMAVSLETRVPLLDHRVVEFARRLPHRMKARGGKGKWLLRNVLARYVPSSLIERPKMGFGVPIDHWLRGPLADWAESLLSEAALRRHGVLAPAPIRQAWLAHRSGTQQLHYPLWTALMLQDWLEREKASAADAPRQVSRQPLAGS